MAAEGRLVLDGTLDLSSPGSSYRLDAQAEELRLSLVTEGLPDPSIFSGHVALEGSGFALDSLEGTASVTVRESRVGAFRIDTVSATLHASRGVLTVDTVEAYGSGVEVAGRGSFGMVAGADGQAHFEFSIGKPPQIVISGFCRPSPSAPPP